jgi:hypothetical protein
MENACEAGPDDQVLTVIVKGSEQDSQEFKYKVSETRMVKPSRSYPSIPGS